MTFCMRHLLRLKARNEVSRCMVRALDSGSACCVPIPTDRIPNSVACVNMSDDFFYGIFQRDTALFSFFDSGRIHLVLSGSWVTLVIVLALLTYSTTIDEN